MEHALALHVPSTREDSSSSATEDPLNLQDLWPITTEFTNAAHRVAAAIISVAALLSQDNNPNTAALRQELLEIRARLIYLFSDVGVGVIAVTTHLITITATTISAHLRNDPRADSPSDLAYMVTSILDSCASSNILLHDTLTVWDTFLTSFQEYHSRARSLPTGSVVSILRSIGTFASLSSPPLPEQPNPATHGVKRDLLQMLTSIDRIEAFWRKRQNLYNGSGYTFGHDEMVHFHRSCNQLGTAYLHLVTPLRNGQFDLSMAQPPIEVSPDSLNKDTRIKLSWRALLG